MTNTGTRPLAPERVATKVAQARVLISRVELVQRYLDEADLQGMAADEAFLGTDLVLIRDDRLVVVDVVSWETAEVSISMCDLIDTADDFTTEVMWSVRLVDVPWQLFSRTLSGALQELAKT